MLTNKASVIVNKYKGVNVALSLIKHSFREVKEYKENIFQSMTKNNFYFLGGEVKNDGDEKKSIFMKDRLLENIDFVKNEFEKTMKKTRKSRRQSWESYASNKYIMQEVLINVSPRWWEEQKFVKFHEERFLNENTKHIDKYKWGIKEISKPDKLKEWSVSQISWMKEELKKTYGNENNYLGAALHLDEKTPHLHIFLSTIDFSYDKRKGSHVYKLSTKPLTENRYNELQSSIWSHNKNNWDKSLVRGISQSISGYNYKSLVEFRKSTNLKLIKNHLKIKAIKDQWLDYKKSWDLNNKKINSIMRDMLFYKSINKEQEYLEAKQELEKLGLNFSQTSDIENFVDKIIERSKA